MKDDGPEQNTALCKNCTEDEDSQSDAQWHPYSCSRCQKDGRTKQGKDAHEEGCGLTEKDREESWTQWQQKKYPY